MSNEIEYVKAVYEDGQVLEADDMNRIERYLEDIYSILNVKPQIIIDNNVMYTSINERPILRFKALYRGKAIVTIKEGEAVLYNETTSLKEFEIYLTPYILTGDHEYTISIEDGLGNKGEQVKITNHIINSSLYFYNNNNKTKTTEDLLASYVPGQDQFVDFSDIQLCFELQGTTPQELQIRYRSKNSLNPEFNIEEEIEWTHSQSEHICNFTPTIEIEDNNLIGELEIYLDYKIENNNDWITISPIFVNYYIIEENTIKVQFKNENLSFNSNQKIKIELKLIDPRKLSKESLGETEITLISQGEQSSVLSLTMDNIANNAYFILDFNTSVEAGTYTIQFINNGITVTKDIVIKQGAGYVADESLLIYFNATTYDQDEDKNQWYNSIEDYSENVLNLSGNYQCIKNDNEPDHMLFNPNGIGALNFQNDFITNKLSGKEFTIELYCKSENIGEYYAPILTSKTVFSNTKKGINVLFNRVEIGSNIFRAGDGDKLRDNINMLENKWNHVVITFNETKPDAIYEQDKEYFYSCKIYINGCLVACQMLNDTITQPWQALLDNNNQLLINGYVSIEDNFVPKFSGLTRLSKLRLYNRGLNSTEVIQNYKNCIEWDTNLTNTFITRENNTNIAQLVFVRNKDGKINKKDIYSIQFSELHGITKKYPETETEKASKNSAVNCTMYIMQDKKIGIYPNVDVYLQGTSSLSYPIKNYQIKNYEGYQEAKNFNLKDIFKNPSNKNEEWEYEEQVYTLKCDYMEHSHRNNTPTAKYYEEKVLPTVIKALHNTDNIESYYSPPKASGNNAYRDAIDGWPILVYYNDNNLEDLNANNIQNESQMLSLISNSTPTGSYMFNIDKEGKVLGFEYERETPTTTTIQAELEDAYIENYNTDDNGKMVLELDRAIQYINGINDNDEPVIDTYIPQGDNTKKFILCCYKINKSVSKIQFNRYDFTDIIKNPNNYNYEAKTITWDEPQLQEDEIPYYISLVESYNYDKKVCVSLEGSTSTDFQKACNFYTVNEANDGDDQGKSKYAFYMSTLEPRFTSFKKMTDLINRYALEYYKIDQLIKLLRLYIKLNLTSKQEDEKKCFINTFEDMISKEYILTHYMQMLILGQSDNSGKNSMYDFWDWGKIYSRPYDMDTQVGLSNSGGTDTIPSYIELYEYFPCHNSATLEDENNSISITYNDQNTVDDVNRKKLLGYNTRNSRLWKFVTDLYKEEIKQLYKALTISNSNAGIEAPYELEKLMSYINKYTSEIISEQQYNIDANLKYLAPSDGLYGTIAGNRTDRYYQYMQERLNFLNSIFFIDGDNNKYAYRTTTLTGDQISKVNFEVLYPSYISIYRENYGTNYFFLEPSMQYNATVNNQNVSIPGALIQYTASGTGAGTDTRLGMPQAIKTLKSDINTSLTLPNMSSFTNLSKFALYQGSFAGINSANKLNELEIESSSITKFNLSDYQNLKILKLKSSELTEFTVNEEPDPIPVHALTQLDLTGCTKLNSLSLVNLPNLLQEQIKIEENNNLQTIIIDSCDMITDLNLSQYKKLQKIVIKNCKSLETLNCDQLPQLQVFTIENCPSLTKILLNQYPLSELDLSNIYPQGFDDENKNLKQIDLTQSENLEVLGLPTGIKPTLLSLYDCKNMKQLNSTEQYTYDFDDIEIVYDPTLNKPYFENPNLPLKTGLKLYNNLKVKHIKNLIFGGVGDYMFRDCRELISLTDSEFYLTKSTCYMFFYCQKLATCTGIIIDKLEQEKWALDNIKQTFYVANKIPAQIIKTFFENIVQGNNTLTDMSHAFRRGGTSSQDPFTLNDTSIIPSSVTNMTHAFASSGLKEIPQSFFSEATSLQTLTGCFRNNPLLTKIPKCKIYDKTTEELTEIDKTTKEPTEIAGLFEKCVNLKTADYVFLDCTNLKEFEGEGNEKYIIFDNTNTNLINIDGLFKNCINLGFDNQMTINKFMTNNFSSSITSMQETFRNTKFNKIDSGVFNGFNYLSKCQGAFSQIQFNCTIPNQLYTVTNNEWKAKKLDLGGLFANSTFIPTKDSTDIIISANFFTNLKPKIANIGVSSTPVLDNYDDQNCIVGMFANSNITGCMPTTFQDMEQLTSISGLFAYNCTTIKGIDTDDKQYYYIIPLNSTQTEETDEDTIIPPTPFKGYYDSENNNMSNQIDTNMFKGCKILSDVKCAFMGSNIESINQCTGEGNNEYLLPSIINDISGLFAHGTLQNGADYIIEKNAVHTMKYTFCGADNISPHQIKFNNYENLTDIQGVFAFTSLENEDNIEVDADKIAISNTITNASYIFANSKIKTIPSNLFKNAININTVKGAFYKSNLQRGAEAYTPFNHTIEIQPGVQQVQKYNDLQDISYMFGGLASYDNDSLMVNSDWLAHCNGINKIKGLFYQLRSGNPTQPIQIDTLNQYFSDNKLISQADYLFAEAVIEAEVTDAFLASSRGNLVSCEGIFASSTRPSSNRLQINNSFGYTNGNIINNIKYGFYNQVFVNASASTDILPDRSSFNRINSSDDKEKEIAAHCWYPLNSSTQNWKPDNSAKVTTSIKTIISNAINADINNEDNVYIKVLPVRAPK